MYFFFKKTKAAFRHLFLVSRALLQTLKSHVRKQLNVQSKYKSNNENKWQSKRRRNEITKRNLGIPMIEHHDEKNTKIKVITKSNHFVCLPKTRRKYIVVLLSPIFTAYRVFEQDSVLHQNTAMLWSIPGYANNTVIIKLY